MRRPRIAPGAPEAPFSRGAAFSFAVDRGKLDRGSFGKGCRNSRHSKHTAMKRSLSAERIVVSALVQERRPLQLYEGLHEPPKTVPVEFTCEHDVAQTRSQELEASFFCAPYSDVILRGMNQIDKAVS
jgi:hypothetical protein